MVGQNPEPVVVFPLSGDHKQTFIVLHGRGSNGDEFGAGILLTPIPEFDNVQAAFPDAKFVFPTAARLRARVFGNTPINQWFDIASLTDPDEQDDVQIEGLRESTAYVHGLLASAIDEVGAGNVVLWGLSQGCAIMLTSLLLWTGEPFAAAIGMCGWLPLGQRMLDVCAAHPEGEALDDDPFVRDPDEKPSKDVLERAIACLAELIDKPLESTSSSPMCLHIPIFLGHGVLDEKVAVELGRHATAFLRSMDLDVYWQEYEGLGHWYSGFMLRDIVHFISRAQSFSRL